MSATLIYRVEPGGLCFRAILNIPDDTFDYAEGVIQAVRWAIQNKAGVVSSRLPPEVDAELCYKIRAEGAFYYSYAGRCADNRGVFLETLTEILTREIHVAAMGSPRQGLQRWPKEPLVTPPEVKTCWQRLIEGLDL